MKIKKKGDGYYLVNGKYHWSENDENTLFITEIPLKKWTRDYANLLRELMGVEIIEDNDKNEKKGKKKKDKKKNEDNEDKTKEKKKKQIILEDMKQNHAGNKLNFYLIY